MTGRAVPEDPAPEGPGRSLLVHGGRPLRGTVRVPGDKSVSHRAVLLGALAEGTSQVRGLSDGDDVARTVEAARAIGAAVEAETVTGGAARLHAPAAPLDAGNSGTTMRLVAGLVAGWPWTVELRGDASLSARPMDRIAEPLRAMGARVDGRGPRCLPPITVRGGALAGIDYRPPMASAQVKSAVLLAGLRARGETVVREPVATRAHTEELLRLAGADVHVGEEGGERVVRLHPSSLAPFDLDVPGDPSQAAFWVVAATVVPASVVALEGVYVGETRRGFLDVLARMGAAVEERATGAPGAMPVADLTVRAASLSGTEVRAEEITGLDEVPVLAVAAAVAAGTTVFRGVGELRVKESDRFAGVLAMLGAFGVRAEAAGDDLVVHGPSVLRPAHVDAAGDHRMAMAAAVAGLAVPEAGGATTVTGFEAVATSYPAFAAHLRMLTGFAEHEVGA
ncbi:MAG TPA: 3-phosphoshikimate 1-carboxyvinyltransferase [Acidimicrobiales bacterium]|nr:3-phosphoshikimate 1-carboxyvinyltransferase [Acidimicrobiales bacterium]